MSMPNKMEELCWLYANSKSYEEFDIKRSIECSSCIKRWKFMDIFWWYTLNKNCAYNVDAIWKGLNNKLMPEKNWEYTAERGFRGVNNIHP